MSNSDTKIPAQATIPETTTTLSTPTFSEQVDSAIKSMVKDEKGVLQLPASDTELSPELQYAVTAEKRRRDTHGSYTKSRQELAQANSEITALTAHLSSTTPQLTTEQTTELDELKYSDPDAWRSKLNDYEQTARTSHKAELTQVSKEARNASEVTRRTEVLETFITDNPGFTLVDDDVPPRISKRLESGEVSFEDFLSEVYTYTQTPKTVLTPQPDADSADEVDLGSIAGTSSPQTRAVTANIEHEYANTDIF